MFTSKADALLFCCGEEKAEPKGKVLCLWIDFSIPSLIYGHELSLRDGERSSVIQEKLNVEVLIRGAG